ncbi:hypothetical protein D9M72_511900 [compost metagenome]
MRVHGVVQRVELVHVECGKAVELDRTDVAARTLDPENLDRTAAKRILFHHLGRGVAAAVIGDALVGTEQVGAIQQPLGFAHAGSSRLVPKVCKSCALLLVEHLEFLPV